MNEYTWIFNKVESIDYNTKRYTSLIYTITYSRMRVISCLRNILVSNHEINWLIEDFVWLIYVFETYVDTKDKI